VVQWFPNGARVVYNGKHLFVVYKDWSARPIVCLAERLGYPVRDMIEVPRGEVVLEVSRAFFQISVAVNVCSSLILWPCKKNAVQNSLVGNLRKSRYFSHSSSLPLASKKSGQKRIG